MKKTAVLILALCLLLTALLPLPTRAAGGLEVLDSRVELDFPGRRDGQGRIDPEDKQNRKPGNPQGIRFQPYDRNGRMVHGHGL